MGIPAGLADRIREELRLNSDEKIKESGQRFFKENVRLYGIKTEAVKKIGQKYFKEIKEEERLDIFSACEELMKTGFMEESFIASNWSYYIRSRYKQEDFNIFERWVNSYVSNWASCDTLCNHTIGAFIEMYPEYLDKLKEWAKSSNRWVRRASAVSLIIPAKKGLFPDDIFSIADILLADKDDLVQKGYGWMLKSACKNHEKEVFDYVMDNKKEMPRTALRYAIEKMPPELKAALMKK